MTAAGETSAFYKLCVLGAVLAILTLLTPIGFKTWGDNAYIALAALRDATIYPNINRADYALTIYPLPRMTKSLLL